MTTHLNKGRKVLGRWLDAFRLRLKILNYRKDFEKNAVLSPPLLIYQMGKVGSSSVYYSAKKTYPGYVMHLHNFNDANKNYKIKTFKDWGCQNKRPIKIISLTREPVGRNVSAFFQNLEKITDDTGIPENISAESLQKLFLDNNKMNHDEPLTWFDDNLLKDFEIDIYKSPFPISGWQIVKNGNTEVLIIKSEIEDSIKEAIIRTFLVDNTFKLELHNLGNTKGYAMLYNAFLTKIKLPATYLDRLLLSKYCTHFYNAAERESVRERWIEFK